MIYFCCEDRRRGAVERHPIINGIDFIEVIDRGSDPLEQRQHRLLVHFLKDIAPGALTIGNVIIEGGERIRNIKIVKVSAPMISSPPASPPGSEAKILAVEVAEPGDFSTYTLRLVQDLAHREPPAGFDPVLSSIDFSFKVSCPSDFDCRAKSDCPPELLRQPEINYLAKDYGSFRQLMLDRMAALVPEWRERNPGDMGIVLVELLAYVGDYLSYRQDAVATEAYLGTARKRTSVRRHARLVDYSMHDGCNARVWVHIHANVGVHDVVMKRGTRERTTQFLARVEGISPGLITPNTPIYAKALAAGPEVFEPLHDLRLFEIHNTFRFYTWDSQECCLPKGATRATLRGHYPHLEQGDVLIVQEVLGPRTGVEEDADPTHRHAVRLTEVKLTNDPIYELPASPPSSPPGGSGVPLTEIAWHPADALPFPLCISSVTDEAHGAKLVEDVSVALGNIVLADHGKTLADEPLGEVPLSNPVLAYITASGSDRCEPQTATPTPPRFRPRLKLGPLTQGMPYDHQKPPSSASATVRGTPDASLPMVVLREEGANDHAGDWIPKRDLLNSHRDDKHFVVETDTETEAVAYLRFGDDLFGARPAAETRFLASYRIGNGLRGNIGAGALAHLVSDDPNITDQVIETVWNPLPAQGGLDPESIEQVRQNAPQAFRRQQRAVTPEDYANAAQRCDPDIQRAAATFRWTGSWRTVFLTVDLLGGIEPDKDSEQNLRRCLERYRMAGQDLEVDVPRYVSLELDMSVCVKPNYFASDVKAALLDVFSSRTLADGRRGVFHPDNFSFGQTVFVSLLYAAAQSVPGVDSVEITKFQRQGIPSDLALQTGALVLERLEIARLDNDPNFRERGAINLTVRGR